MIDNALIYRNNTNCGLVFGTTTTLTTTSATNATLRGKFTTALAAAANFATPTVDASTLLPIAPITSTATGGSAACVLFGVNAAGAIRVTVGRPEATELGVTTVPGAVIYAPQFPPVPDDFCPIGYTIARTSPSVPTITVGTTAWAGSPNFSVIRNIADLPDRPQAGF